MKIKIDENLPASLVEAFTRSDSRSAATVGATSITAACRTRKETEQESEANKGELIELGWTGRPSMPA